MTIRTHIDLHRWSDRLADLERCAEEAPERTYQRAKDVAELLGDIVDDALTRISAAGFKTDNCDGAREVHALLYAWLVEANPDCNDLLVAEGFGEHLLGPARERILQAAIDDRDFLERTERGRNLDVFTPTADEIIAGLQ